MNIVSSYVYFYLIASLAINMHIGSQKVHRIVCMSVCRFIYPQKKSFAPKIDIYFWYFHFVKSRND